MAVINTNLVCDLQKAVKVEYIDGVLFSQDNQANQINVTVLDGGEPATISGTVSANIIRSDGGTVAASGGSITGNVASITLPAAAYAVPGVVSIVVKLTASGVITTIAAIVGNMYRSSTDTAIDPGTVIPSIQTLISQINAAVASIPADYSSLWTKLAPAFSTDASYVAGQYVTYNSGLYRFNTTHTGGWSSSDVTAVNLGGEITDLKSAFNYSSGIECISLIRGAYIITSTSTVDMTPVSSSSFDNGGYAIVDCSEGDIFVINGTGGGNGRLWCFVDSSNVSISKSDSSVTANNLILIAPVNSSKLIINSTTNKTNIKGLSPDIRLDRNEDYILVSSIGHGAENIYVEQGAISGSTGEEVDSSIRIRTGYIKFDSYPVTITAASGYEFNFYGYNEDFTYHGTYDFTTSYQLTKSDYWYRFVIRKSDNANITPDDFNSSISSGFGTSNCIIQSKKLYNEIKQTNIEINIITTDIKNIASGSEIYVEQGAISAQGVDVYLSNRIKTGYIKFNTYPVTITMASGYKLKPYTYNEDFSYNATADWRTEYTISGDDYYRRFVIGKSDDSDIIPDDYSSAIAAGMANAYCIIPSRQLQNEIDGIKTLDEEYSLKLNQFNLNRNMVGNGDMIWEYQNWVFPQIISYNGIRNRLYFTFTSDAGYSGIAQYDYDTKELTKNILKQNVSGARDDHDLIGLIMLPSKKILCAYSGGHNTDKNMYIRIANARESIETFENVITLKCSDNTTYAQLFNYNNKVYLFYRLNNIAWAYRISTNGGTTWSDETILMTNNEQIYCQFTETTTAGVLRMCCYTNPGESDTAIRMGFLHLDNMTLYDTDNSTVIGTSNIQRTSVTVVISVPTDGKVNRLFNAAKTDISKTLILYSVFSITGTEAGEDGKYFVYDDGTTVEVANCGLAQWTPKAQLGVAWIGTSQIAVARGYDGKDWIEIYDYSSGVVELNHTVTFADRESHGTQNYRTARPMVDNNNKALIYCQGYFNIDSFEDFIMNGHIYSLEDEEIII